MSGPKIFTATSPRTPLIISWTRMSIGCVKLSDSPGKSAST